MRLRAKPALSPRLGHSMMNQEVRVILVRNDRPPERQPRHPRHLHPPLDLRYVQAGLEATGRRAELLDNWILRRAPEALAAEVVARDASVVVVKGDSSCLAESLAFGRLLRERGVTVLALGQQVAHAVHQPVSGWDEAFDFAFYGEPEEAVPGILCRLMSGEPLSQVTGAYQAAFARGEPTLVVDPETLPPLRHGADELHRYPFPFPVRGSFVTTWAYVQTSWGCPHSGRCRFCSDILRKSMGTRLRLRRPESVVTELESVLAQGADAVCFEDNSLLTDKAHFLGVCEQIRQRGLTFSWIASARADDVDDEKARAAAESGCVLLKLGVESGSPRVIEALRKTVEPGERWVDQVRVANSLLSANGIGCVGLVMIGCPDETDEEVQATMRLLSELDPDYVQIQIFSLYPDSLFYRGLDAKEKARYAVANGLYHYGLPRWTPSRIRPQRLLELQEEAYRRFYLRPSHVWKHARLFWRFYLRPSVAVRAMRGAWLSMMGVSG